MDITKETLQYVVGLKKPEKLEIGGYTYCTDEVVRIDPPKYSPRDITVNGLNSLVNLIKQENAKVHHPIFVEVKSFNRVQAYTTYDEQFERQNMYEAVSDTPDFRFGWKEHSEAMIAFRSQFKPTTDINYILDLLGKISDEKSVSSEDNGLTQKVEVKQGIALKGVQVIKPIVSVTPFRTFMEIEQPESQFLLRLREDGCIGLFEADGGMWKLTAKESIKQYLETELAELIADGTVVVMC